MSASNPLNLPPEHIMREMAKLAAEQSARMIENLANDMADRMERGLIPMTDGPTALRACAAAARSSADKAWPKPSGAQS
jgi:hypothetical protein